MIGKDFIFIETPKCATTSFREWAFDNKLADRKFNDSLKRHIRGEAYRNLVTESTHPFKNWVAFVRNPYSRLVSQYEYLKKIGTKPSDAVKNDNHTKFGRRIVEEYDKFEDFVLAIKTDYQINFHLSETTQASFITVPVRGMLSTVEKVIPNLIKIERLHLDFAELCRRMKWEFSILPHHNISSHKSWQDYYSEDMKTLVYNYYKKDFDLGGYFR